jgi:phosphoribosylamine---glycine ligase
MALPLASAQDHKRAFDGETGPNTGGMGAYSPAPALTPELGERTMQQIIVPTLRAMKAMGAPYRGVLYAGLMIKEDAIRLLEYNVRFGDPECQVLMRRLMSDLVPALMAARDGLLKNFDLRWYPQVALGVVLAAKGYPGHFRRGSTIHGVEEAASRQDVVIFHAGTRREGDRLLANGGRVLTVSAIGDTIAEAQARTYAAVTSIDWPDGFYRRDIGWRGVARERGSRTTEQA